MASTVSAARPRSGLVQNPHSRRPAWFYPTAVVVAFSAFVIYSTAVVILEKSGSWGPYISPFFSPTLNITIGGFLIPPAIFVAWAPLAFRLTCYYYRKAYFRGFLGHPRACASDEPVRGDYRGETRFWIFNNLHRFALYLILIQTVLLAYDVVMSFWFRGGLHFGLGSAIMIVNLVFLSAYTFGCHGLRHLVGGGSNCLSCSSVRFQLWKGVTVLNVRHETWAWVSMFSVWFTDVYIRLGLHGHIPSSWG